MVHEVKTETQFGAEINDGWELNEFMTDVEATQKWVDAVRTTGSSKWQQMAGQGQFQGLQEALSSKAGAVVGQCEPGEGTTCVVDVSVENVEDGDIKSGAVMLHCPLRLFMREEDAVAVEDICEQHHREAPAIFKAHVIAAVENFEAAAQARAEAEKAYQIAKQAL